MKKIIEPCGLHCIKVNHLGVTIGGQQILSDINLHIHCGTLTAIIGKNGAGKSTLIKAMLGDIPHEGNIEFKDRENGKIQKLKIGYVPQSMNIEKNTPISVYDMIASYQSNFPVFFRKKQALYEEIKDSLKVFEADYLIDKQVCNLSGGELQRFCIARALGPATRFLLCDEMSTMLDLVTQAQIWNFLLEEAARRELGLLIVSHTPALLERLCTRTQPLDPSPV